MADIATASINSLNNAVNLLTRAASRLDEQLYSFKDFLKEYQAKNEVANKALFDQYKKLLDDKEKSNKEKKGDAGNILFKDADKQTKTSIKNDVYTPMLTKIGLSMSTQNLKLDQIISIFKEKGKEKKDDKSSSTILSLIESFKTAKTEKFVSATEAAEKDSVTLHDVTDTALNKLRTLFTEPQKQQVKGKASDTAGNSGAMGKAGSILLIGAAAVAITGFMLVVAKFADIPVANIAKVAAIMGMLGLAIYGLTKIPSKDMITIALAMGVLSLSLLGISIALEKMAAVPWEGVLKGVLVMGLLTVAMLVMSGQAPMVLVASLALGVLALSMMGITAALMGLQEVQWETLGKFAVFLVGMVAGLAALTPLIPFLLPGLALFAGLGAALVIFGAGVAAVGAGLQLLTPSLPLLTQFFSEISSVNPIALMALAPGIIAFSLSLGVLSTALLAFSASKLISGAISSIGSMFSSLVPDDEVKKIQTAISAIKELQKVQGSVNLGPLNEGIVKFADAVDKIDSKKVSNFASSVVSVSNGMNSAAPAVQKFANISLENIVKEMNSLDDTAGRLNPALMSLAAVDLRPLASNAKGLRGVTDAINDINVGNLDAMSKANLNNLAQGLTSIAGVSNLNLEQPITQVRALVDTVNDISLLKITALASVIAAGKPLELNIQAKAPQKGVDKDKIAIENSSESLEKAVGAFKEQTGGQLSSMITVLEQLTKILKEKEFTQSNTVVAPTSINSGGNGGASAPVLGPSSINTKALAQSPFSLNGRNSQ